MVMMLMLMMTRLDPSGQSGDVKTEYHHEKVDEDDADANGDYYVDVDDDKIRSLWSESGDRPISFDRGPSHLVKILNPQTDHHYHPHYHDDDDDDDARVSMVTSG